MKSLKVALGVLAFAAPILLGVAYTAGASISGEGVGIGGHQQVDQWVMNTDGSGDYTLDREELDGAVTLVVTGPDGDVVAVEDYPDFVAEAVAEFGAADWEPADADLFETVAGTPCYREDLLDVEGDSFDIQTTNDSGTYALLVDSDGSVDAAYFDGDVSHEELVAHQATGQPYIEFAGAQELLACEG